MTDKPKTPERKLRMATYTGWLPGQPEKEIRRVLDERALDGLTLVDITADITAREGRIWREQQTWSDDPTWADDPDFDDD